MIGLSKFDLKEEKRLLTMSPTKVLQRISGIERSNKRGVSIMTVEAFSEDRGCEGLQDQN